MSELKAHHFCEIDEVFREYHGPLSNEMHLYYLKSEVDKVIAELETRIKEGDKEFDFADHQNERLLKELRHNKYKRCLALANLWRERYENSNDDDNIAVSLLRHEKWLKLAKKFKECK